MFWVQARTGRAEPYETPFQKVREMVLEGLVMWFEPWIVHPGVHVRPEFASLLPPDLSAASDPPIVLLLPRIP